MTRQNQRSMAAVAKAYLRSRPDEYAMKLCDCKAGETIEVSFNRPSNAFLYSEDSYREHLAGNYWLAPSFIEDSTDGLTATFDVRADGNWFLVVKTERLKDLKVSVSRHAQDIVVWNDSHPKTKIVRKLPTPFEAPMASTLGYWERKTGVTLSATDLCPICCAVLKREDIRCALVTIPGELPRRHYVFPVCRHCHDHADGRTFMVEKQVLAIAPKT